jgi:hypothetical protein
MTSQNSPRTHALIVFALTQLDSGRFLGHAGIAPSARYISIAWSGASRMDRLYAEPIEWRAYGSAVRNHLHSTPLESTHIVVRMLLPKERRTSVNVQCVTLVQVQAGAPQELTTQLDATLRGFGAA